MSRIGIMSAMVEEMNILLKSIKNEKIETIGQREYHTGKLFDNDVVLVFSRWGKVAASSTTTTLINNFRVDKIIFTGVAGAINNKLNIGDIVIAKNLYQHDFDASPLLNKHVLPHINKKEIPTNKALNTQLIKSAKQFIATQLNNTITNNELDVFNISTPEIVYGNIASGDQFIKTSNQRELIRTELNEVEAVEMEGGAVAQICYEYNIPLAVIRTISDKAGSDAAIDFPRFVENIAGKYSYKIIENLLSEIN
ncbi:MAG: 5'-methylthioadenosine/adenosylhomocysteine nucleosidase [Ichthyobacteriaceae bacterium]|nr:5'-methylthioadenosine/adenosylhomocysteine nucleosidase [Ichthyobacteriaceae bacterium]